MNNLPPDVLAYLEEATTTIAQEQNFSPANKEELANWLKLNLAKIVVKAKELQFNCWVKFVSNQEAHDLVSETITKQVWNYHNSTDSTILKTLS